jgi:hypothetical protein
MPMVWRRFILDRCNTCSEKDKNWVTAPLDDFTSKLIEAHKQ